MICIVRIFGAPVIEPQGNRAASTCVGSASVRAATVDVSCKTVR